MIVMDGKSLASTIKNQVKMEVDEWLKTHRTISLTVIQVGDNAASNIYIRNKERACIECDIETETIKLPETVTKAELMNIIKSLNYSETTGILVQLPLPEHFSSKDVNDILSCIDPIKDVDGFHNQNMGAVVKNEYQLIPCTPSGIMSLLDNYGIDVSGKRCVVVGRSNIVGKPIAMMLLNCDATVTICHSKTQNLQQICQEADVLICAVGKPKFFTANYIKPNAVVVDVGIHHTEEGICGDVDYENVHQLTYAISPVPKGVGAMTVASLMKNCLIAAQLQNEREENEWNQ